MPIFGVEYPWCSPAELRNLMLRDFVILQRYLIDRAERLERARKRRELGLHGG